MQVSESPNASPKVYTPERKIVDPWIPDEQTTIDLSTTKDTFETVRMAFQRAMHFGTESRFSYSIYAALMTLSPERMKAFEGHPKLRPAYLAYSEYLKIRDKQYLENLIMLPESDFETYVQQMPKILQEKLRQTWHEYHQEAFEN